MAKSTCVKCGATTFEMVLSEPKGSAWKLYFIQCSACGGVAGFQEYNNITTMLIQQNKAIEAIAKKVGVSVTLLTK